MLSSGEVFFISAVVRILFLEKSKYKENLNVNYTYVLQYITKELKDNIVLTDPI